MSDDYAKGAAAAAADMPHNRNALRSFQRIPATIRPGGDNMVKEFSAGYTETHRAMSGDLHRNQTVSLAGVPAASISNSTSGAPGMNAAEQIQHLEDLISYLGQFQERLMGVSSNYQRKVDALDGPVLQDIHQQFVADELEPARALIAQLVDLIEGSSVPAVRRRIRQWEIIQNDES